MAERYVIVAKERNGYGTDTTFHYEKNERDAIDCVMQLANRSTLDGEPATVERVFKFNEHGRVTHYEMTIKGFKPALEPIPEQGR